MDICATRNRTLTIKDGARTTSTFDAANQNVYSLDAAGRTTYTFDASGNRTVVQKPDNSRTTTSYDYENRDIHVQLPTGIINTMAYDPDGLRVLLQDSNGTKKFVYDNQQYLLETDGSNVVTAVQTQEPGTYSNLVSQYRLTNGLWLPSYHHYDSLGNTAELTDASENITDTYQYNAWGELLSQTGATPNPFQWRGRYSYYLVPDTGDIYVIMRTYDPTTGRWTTLDLLKFVDGLNMYLAYFVPGGIDMNGQACKLTYKCQTIGISHDTKLNTTTCRFSCTEIKRELMAGGDTFTCNDFEVLTRKPDGSKPPHTFEESVTLSGACTPCKDPDDKKVIYSFEERGLDCSVSDCKDHCKTGKSLDKYLCRLLPPDLQLGCKIATKGGRALCEAYCELCKNP